MKTQHSYAKVKFLNFKGGIHAAKRTFPYF